MGNEEENEIIPEVDGEAIPPHGKLLDHDTTHSITAGLQAVKDLEADLGRMPTMDEAFEAMFNGYVRQEQRDESKREEEAKHVVDGEIKE